jgi:hypothetical protein
MKYTAKPLQLQPGKWAVFTGKRYFENTVTTSKDEANKQAMIMSANWHWNEIRALQKKLVKIDPELDDVGRIID